MKNIGLCLTGGGARGSYQAGAIKALEEMGILQKIYAVSGTSIGSVNATLLACKNPDEIKELWFSYSSNDFNKDTSIFKALREKKLDVVNSGIYEISLLEKLLQDNIDYEKIKQQKTFITLSPAGMENEGVMGLLKSSFKHFIKNESQVIYSPLHKQKEELVVKQILASCSIPFVFPSVHMDGMQVFDGGLYDNAPIKPLIDAGCDTIIVIHLFKLFFINKNKYPGINLYEVKPSKSLGGTLNFDQDQAQKRFEMGYHDTLNYFKENILI